MRAVAVILAALILASCATQRATSTHKVDRDSTYLSTHQLDNLYRALWQRDSVYRRDSTHVYQNGDTVTKYVEKEVYKWRTRTDTVYRDRWRVDTMYVERVDSVTVEKPVYIEKQLKWYNQGFIWLGRVCLAALLLWLVYKIVRWKLKL